MRLLNIFLALLLSYLLYSLWFGQNGFLDKRNIEKDVIALREDNTQRQVRNDRIIAEVDDLKNGVNALEERARLEREMVKGDEVFYRIVPRNQ